MCIRDRTEEEGAESFLAALETGLTSEEQKKDKSTMPVSYTHLDVYKRQCSADAVARLPDALGEVNSRPFISL